MSDDVTFALSTNFKLPRGIGESLKEDDFIENTKAGNDFSLEIVVSNPFVNITALKESVFARLEVTQ